MNAKTDSSPLPLKRRRFLGSALAAGVGGMALTPALLAQSRRSRTQDDDSNRISPEDSDKQGRIPSPYTTPFVEPLPLPAIKTPVDALYPAPTKSAGPYEAGRLPHQAWERWPVKQGNFYELHVKEAYHSFHPELPVQKIWGYDGTFPGPTFLARSGTPMLVRIYNDLPANHVGFGSPEITTHVHNAHTASESDGFPDDFYSATKHGPGLSRPGRYKDHHYPNVPAGYHPILYPKGNLEECLGTMWYHDHRTNFTAANVYRGLAGFFLYLDDIDSGDEEDPNEGSLHLPSGINQHDIPLLFDDKRFDSSGYLYFNQFDNEGIPGDKFCVNGKIQPYFEVARRKYRFRMLNGAVLRFFELYLTYQDVDQHFDYIANDGNLLPECLDADHVRIMPAERGDIVIDFSKYPVGSKLYLVNRLEQLDGRGPTNQLLMPGTPVLRFDVTREPPKPDTSQVPAMLRKLSPVNLAMVKRERHIRLERENGVWVINGKIYDGEKPLFTCKRGELEKWTFQNSSGWSHPLHIHLDEGRIISRNGKPPPLHERGRKDMYELRPEEELSLVIRFADFTGKYVVHCHNLVHEDHHMMIRFDVV